MTNCGTPPMIPGGNVKDMNDTGVQYRCNSGYRMSGNDIILCVNNVWEITTELPSCTIGWKTWKVYPDEIKYDSYTSVSAEIPDWLLGMYATVTAWVGLVFLVCLLLMLTTVCWCVHFRKCRGQVIDIDGTHVYPEQLCCRYVFCCFRMKRTKKKFSHRKKLLQATKGNKKMQNAISKLAASKVIPTIEAETSLLLVPKQEVKPEEKAELTLEKETPFKPKLEKKKKSEAPKKKKVKVKQNARDAYNKNGAEAMQPKNKIVY